MSTLRSKFLYISVNANLLIFYPKSRFGGNWLNVSKTNTWGSLSVRSECSENIEWKAK